MHCVKVVQLTTVLFQTEHFVWIGAFFDFPSKGSLYTVPVPLQHDFLAFGALIARALF